jgi:ATP-dependent DNA ligase
MFASSNDCGGYYQHRTARELLQGVKEMKPQKAKHLHEELEKVTPNLGGEYAVFEKYDGWYGYSDDSNQIRSRAGRIIPSLSHLEMDLPSGTQFQGRLIFEVTLDGVREFSTLNGILNRSKGNCAAPNARLKVHDFIPQHNIEMPFLERYNHATELVRALKLTFMSMAPIIQISDQQETWRSCANAVWQRGGEGVICKRLVAPYSEGKRNSDLIKIKEEVTLDLLVVGMADGEGKYADTLGTLLVKDSRGTVHPISGMTDAQRDEWWYNPSKIVGEVVEVKAMKVLPCGTLREPRLKAVRYDKLISDID